MSDEKYLTLAEVKEILEAEQEIRQLNTEQNYALTHAQRFAKLSAKDSRKLVEELVEIEALTEYHACKLADILPTYPDEIKTVFAKERINLEAETINQIIGIIDKYR